MFPYIFVSERLDRLLGTVVQHRVAKCRHFSIYVANYGSEIFVGLVIELKYYITVKI